MRRPREREAEENKKMRAVKVQEKLIDDLKKIKEVKINKNYNKLKSLYPEEIKKIIRAIVNQRWYFFINKPNVVMDKKTGRLWPNQKYFKKKENLLNYEEVISNMDIDGYTDWSVPEKADLDIIAEDKNSPFDFEILYLIAEQRAMKLNKKDELCYAGIEYDILPMNKIYSEKYYDSEGKIQNQECILELFLKNKLEPIFNDCEITNLYKEMFLKFLSIEKNIGNEIEDIIYDYDKLLENYNLNNINSSIISYYEAIKKWSNELEDRFNKYEELRSKAICDYRDISYELSKEYEYDSNFTEEENTIFKVRQDSLIENFGVRINDVKLILTSLKEQSDDFENRINGIFMSDNSIGKLSNIEKEERASFEFITQGTFKIVKDTVLKIERFNKNKDFIVNIIKLWSKWREDYKIFKVSKRETLRNLCIEDNIEEEIFNEWFNKWNKSRLKIEEKFSYLVNEGIKNNANNEGEKNTVIEKAIKLLQQYKNDIDNFYMEERKSIYQRFAFKTGGDLQEKFEVESEFYNITLVFEKELKELMFELKNEENRISLLNWAEDIIDWPIDEIISLINNKEFNEVSKEIINKFSNLKRKNINSYILDVKSYSEELARREKEYNSLIFKMRKDLEK
ncbi:MAG: hypothetical protein SPE00_03155 [Bacilli bacterium]|nr:hypothetical protein [Bacilli bacterium]